MWSWDLISGLKPGGTQNKRPYGDVPPPQGYSQKKKKKKEHGKAYEDYRSNGLVFHQKFLDMGPILVKNP